MMKINADFDQRVLLHADQIDWMASPMPGVSRRPLDRIGGEVARATTIVRFDPGSVIFVKLWQFDPDDRSHVRIDMNKIGAVADPARAGVRVTPLFKDAHEQVRLEHWAPGTEARIAAAGGE